VVDITQVSVEEDKGLVNGTTATSSFDQDEDLCDSARELIGFYKKQYEKIIGEAHEIQEFISEKTHSIKQWEGALRMAEEAIAKLKSSIGTEILRASSRNRSFSEFSPSLTIKLAKPVKVKSVVIEHPLNGVTSFILALLFETFEFHQVGC